MSQQLEAWQGEFGTAYTTRNVPDWHIRLPAFRHMLDGLSITSALEIGCNRGHNLLALAELLPDCEIVGIEPNGVALGIAQAASPRITALYGHALDIPFPDGSFDLVFTAGVLIHLPLASLSQALRNMHRASRRYLLSIEYSAETETAIPYRGSNELLWKRDFLRHYQAEFPTLALIGSGYWGIENGFDRTHWWLFEKPRMSE